MLNFVTTRTKKKTLKDNIKMRANFEFSINVFTWYLAKEKRTFF